MAEVERTDDGRFIIVNGRKWRATDPSIPETFRQQLVSQLMLARRTIAQQRNDPDAVALARRCVQDAKVALGERGDPWWERATDAGADQRIAATARTLLRTRGPDKTICPSDVARIVGQPDWRERMDDVRRVASELAGAGELVVTQKGEAVDPAAARGAIRYRSGPELERIGEP